MILEAAVFLVIGVDELVLSIERGTGHDEVPQRQDAAGPHGFDGDRDTALGADGLELGMLERMKARSVG